jgi:hypothetical protein
LAMRSWRRSHRHLLVLALTVRYTKEAQANRASGIALAQCVIDLDGRLCDCKILRSVQGMDEPILDALDQMRFRLRLESAPWTA